MTRSEDLHFVKNNSYIMKKCHFFHVRRLEGATLPKYRRTQKSSMANFYDFRTESRPAVFLGSQAYEEILLKVLLSVGFQTNDMLAL